MKAIFKILITVLGLGGGVGVATYSALALSKNTNISSNQEQQLTPKHFVLADWGDGRKWIVSSVEFNNKSNKHDSRKEIGFKDVKMTLGEKEITSDHVLMAPSSWADHILVRPDKTLGFWILEDDSRHSNFELRTRDKFDLLKVNKYNAKPFQEKWRRIGNISDYDVNFESCVFAQERENTITLQGQLALWNVTCKIGNESSGHKITRQLTEYDYL